MPFIQINDNPRSPVNGTEKVTARGAKKQSFWHNGGVGQGGEGLDLLTSASTSGVVYPR